jgi:hypothetical protein
MPCTVRGETLVGPNDKFQLSGLSFLVQCGIEDSDPEIDTSRFAGGPGPVN